MKRRYIIAGLALLFVPTHTTGIRYCSCSYYARYCTLNTCYKSAINLLRQSPGTKQRIKQITQEYITAIEKEHKRQRGAVCAKYSLLLSLIIMTWIVVTHCHGA
jgi:hypothetical protein